MRRLGLLIKFFLLLSVYIQAQDKYEKEYRIQESDVPSQALLFMQNIDFTKKIKWYKEEGLDTSSIEAKTKHKGLKYSLEFNLDGEIEDVEKETKWKNLPKEASEKICDYLSSEYQKTKFSKIQIQYTGDQKKIIRLLNTQRRETGITIKYELVLKTKKDGQYEMVEYLFSEKGEVEKRAKIIFKNTDNIEY